MQSLKRQWGASSSISVKVSLTPESASQSCSSRMPGVSTMRPPLGSVMSWRAVVVCRPLLSDSLMPAVAWMSRPARRLMSVDFPTPDEPRSATVAPGLM